LYPKAPKTPSSYAATGPAIIVFPVIQKASNDVVPKATPNLPFPPIYSSTEFNFLEINQLITINNEPNNKIIPTLKKAIYFAPFLTVSESYIYSLSSFPYKSKTDP